MKHLLSRFWFYLKGTFIICFDKNFSQFQYDYQNLDYERFMQDGERQLTEKENFYIEIISILKPQLKIKGEI